MIAVDVLFHAQISLNDIPTTNSEKHCCLVTIATWIPNTWKYCKEDSPGQSKPKAQATLRIPVFTSQVRQEINS